MSQERTDNLFASESWTAVYTAFTNVSLKAYDFDTIREALLAYTAQTYPEKFNDFIASSEFIAILDLVAYMGHSLAFRLDMNTRENFMDTAERRASILQMAKTLGYNKTRPINAKGYMKISSVTTDEDVLDNEGVSLAGKIINWNDSNNIDWYENFISILNSSFSNTTKIQNPTSKLTIADVDHSLYEINEDATSKNINYPFSSNVGGKSRDFEAVRVVINENTSKIYEDEPNINNKFTIINRNDNLGSASDRTGFFVWAVAGALSFKDENYTKTISNRTQQIADINISNSDVWIQKLDSQRAYVSSVTKVDNDTRETAIYNALRTGSGDIVSINSIENNRIELHYPDGVFGNAATGGYRTWYRKVANENFTVNADDITNEIITIPYKGSDNRTYRITLTITSTRDFSENYSGETYASIRRTAPRSYYSQDRMVNAQDYNVYPLSLGTNVVRKVKSVNTSFAGNSRFYEMDDVLGHHSNLSITGSDGSLFVEDETIKIPLSYNKLQGNSDNFIRNELTKAIKHPSFLNSFFHKYRGNASILVSIAKNYAYDTNNPMKISAPTVVKTINEGDIFELSSLSGTTWATVITVSGTTYTLNKAIQEDGTIVNAVRGLRTKFSEAEVTSIKTKVDSSTEQTFTIKYAIKTGETDIWEWQLHTAAGTPSECHVIFNYSSGIRDNESEYVATFTGKKVAFESRDQVKFFYGNTTDVIDNETNLSMRDAIYLTYASADNSVPGFGSGTGDTITVGQAPVTNSAVYNTVGATFDAVFQYTGTRESYEFAENTAVGVQGTAYTHSLISPDGVEYPLTAAQIIAPTSASGKIIGDATELGNGIDKLALRIDDLSTVTSLSTTIGLDSAVTSSADTNLSTSNITFSGGSQSNATSAFTTISTGNLGTLGFKGKASLPYFQAAATASKWVFRDTEAGVDREQSNMVTSYDTGTTEYTFTLPFYDANYQNQLNINDLDQDIKFKQYPYGEFSIVSATALTTSNVLLRTTSGAFIDADHCTVALVSGTTYKIVFWTHAVTVGDLIDVFVGTPTTLSDIADFSVRVKASFDLATATTTTTSTYKSIASHVYDDYLTNAGYKDNTKVKLFAADTTGHPYALLDITTDKHIVMESYIENNVTYTRASKTAIAAKNVSTGVPDSSVPSTATMWFDTDDSKWYKRIAGIWTETGWVYTVVSGNDILHNAITYTVEEGISFVEDEFTSFRWDHYADLSKRIDPSTSNIVDMYVLSSDYVRNVEKWIANNFTTTTPTAPNNFELSKIMNTIEPKGAIADHIAYIPVEFKYLFGSYAETENQAVFKIIKKLGVGYTDSEIKTEVSKKVNEYFSIDNWDFGATFYFSELAAYLHKELGDYISSVVITPKYASNEFTNLLSISCALNEVFMAVTTSSDVKIITQLSQSELVGE